MNEQYLLYKRPTGFFNKLFTKKFFIYSTLLQKYTLKDGDIFKFIDSMNYWILLIKHVNMPDVIYLIKRSDMDKFIILDENQFKQKIRKQKLKKLQK